MAFPIRRAVLRRNFLQFWTAKRYSNRIAPVLSWQNAAKYTDRVAVIDTYGQHTYKEIFEWSVVLAGHISSHRNTTSSATSAPTVSFLCGNDCSYVVTLLACWLSGSIAVPLCKQHPPVHLEYFIKDSCSSLVIATEEYSPSMADVCKRLSLPFLTLTMDQFVGKGPQVDLEATAKNVSNFTRAMLIYTSGTTGNPKGVVLTFGNLSAQVGALVKSWQMSSKDVVLHSLPLHHMHGIMNALLTPLSVGGTVHMLPKFDASHVWETLTSTKSAVNTFMAVPTMYVKLLEQFDQRFKGKELTEAFVKATCKQKIRLMVSGSSALPQPIFEKWFKVTGHELLERFGMTEIGMALSNPLTGLRKPGFVGTPLPKVKVCIAKPNIYANHKYDVVATGDESGTRVSSGMENESGELYVQGPNVFHEYWNKPQETKAAFTSDGWFRTGDTVQFVDGAYRILGRTSVDIIKSGGYKISALEVERHLLSHPMIADCAVVGLQDITWGQKVAAVVVLKTNPNDRLEAEELRDWCKSSMAPYAVPTVVSFVDELPKSPIGKVNKKTLVQDVFRERPL